MLNKLHLQQTSIRPPVADRSFAAKNRKQYPRLPLVQNTNKTFHAIASKFFNLSDLKASKHFEKIALNSTSAKMNNGKVLYDGHCILSIARKVFE